MISTGINAPLFPTQTQLGRNGPKAGQGERHRAAGDSFPGLTPALEHEGVKRTQWQQGLSVITSSESTGGAAVPECSCWALGTATFRFGGIGAPELLLLGTGHSHVHVWGNHPPFPSPPAWALSVPEGTKKSLPHPSSQQGGDAPLSTTLQPADELTEWGSKSQEGKPGIDGFIPKHSYYLALSAPICSCCCPVLG